MTLAALKQYLQVTTGTDIGEVIFDWSDYLNEKRGKIYPLVLWSLTGASFETDIRTSTIQKEKEITLSVFVIQSFRGSSQDKITVWDTLEGYFNVYLNKINEMSRLSIKNINRIKGDYIGEGTMSADSEIAIRYKEVVLGMYCDDVPEHALLNDDGSMIINDDGSLIITDD